MESQSDPYDHPDGVDCAYIQTSVIHSDDVYAVACSCSGEAPCADECCSCIRTSGLSYVHGKLLEGKLMNPNSSVFECSESCSCGTPCKNRVSQNGPSRALRIVPTVAKGYGVVADSPIPQGTFLCEYAGEVLSSIQMQTRAKVADWRYVITLNEITPGGTLTKTFIDASKFGNVGRYLNHSCDPNCILVPVRYDNVAPKVGIFAARDIKEGEECCYSYAAHDTCLSETPCHCGGENCCGFLPQGCYRET